MCARLCVLAMHVSFISRWSFAVVVFNLIFFIYYIFMQLVPNACLSSYKVSFGVFL